MLLLLITSGAFADISFSGVLGSGANLLGGSSEKDSGLQASGFIWGRLQLDTVTKDGTLGGLLRLRTGFDTLDNQYSWAWQDPDTWQTYNPYGWVWWKPIEQVKLQVGFVDALSTDYIAGWGFNENDAEDYVARAGYEYSGEIFHRSTGFYNGTWWTGAALFIYPIPDLAINIAIPYTRGNIAGQTAADVYGYMHGQAVYSIAGLGKAFLTITGGKQDDWGTPGPMNIAALLSSAGWRDVEKNTANIYASFFVTALEDKNIDINIGASYALPVSGHEDHIDTNLTYYSPVAAGLGLAYSYGKFGIKTRLAATFAGSVKTDNIDPVHEAFKFGFGIIPSYDFGICKVYLNTGIAYKAEDETINGSDKVIKVPDSSAFGWHLNPYVTTMIGGATLYSGLYIESDSVYAKGSKIVNWGIPVAVEYTF